MTDNTATNEHTGDRIATKRSSVYADNYEMLTLAICLRSYFATATEHLNELLKDPIDGFNNNDHSE